MTTDLIRHPVAFRYGTRLPGSIDPVAVNQEIAELLKDDGDLLVDDIISRASDPQSAMHDALEWDNDAAGDKYRAVQAVYLAGSLIDPQTHERVYVSRYKETNDPTDIGRLRINVRLLPTSMATEGTEAGGPVRFTIGTAGEQTVIPQTPEEDRALSTFRRWVDAHKHDPAVLREALRILRETL